MAEKTKTMSSLATIPRKSASLVIFSHKPSKIPDYEVLLLKRKGTMSFANSLAFPGGVCEKNDESIFLDLVKNQSDLEKQIFHSSKKITAIRETFEETGIFLVSTDKIKDKKYVHEIVSKLGLRNELSFEKLVENFGVPMEKLIPLLRIITIQEQKKRYDTYFFGVFLNNPSIVLLNIGNYLKEKTLSSLFCLDKLQINQDESDFYSWVSPENCLTDFLQGKANLAPPQIFHFGHFSAFQKITALEEFYTKEICVDLKSQNLLKKEPFYFPLILYRKNIKKNEFFWIFPGDDEYEYEKIANNEADKELAQEIMEKNLLITQEKKPDKQRVRIHIQFSPEKKPPLHVKEVIFNMDFISPFHGLKKSTILMMMPKL